MGYQAGKPIESVLCCLNSDDNLKKCSNFWLFSWRNVRIEYKFPVILVILERYYSVPVRSPKLFFIYLGLERHFLL